MCIIFFTMILAEWMKIYEWKPPVECKMKNLDMWQRTGISPRGYVWGLWGWLTVRANMTQIVRTIASSGLGGEHIHWKKSEHNQPMTGKGIYSRSDCLVFSCVSSGNFNQEIFSGLPWNYIYIYFFSQTYMDFCVGQHEMDFICNSSWKFSTI